jgi:hypothetical protein
MVWMFVYFSKFMLNPNLQAFVSEGGTFGRWLGHENGVLMNGILAFIKEAWERTISCSFYHIKTQ